MPSSIGSPPKTVEAMQYGLPAFGDLCALASQKNYMALYVCESDLVKAYLAQLGKVSCGKGCIRFKRLTDLNLSTEPFAGDCEAAQSRHRPELPHMSSTRPPKSRLSRRMPGWRRQR